MYLFYANGVVDAGIGLLELLKPGSVRKKPNQLEHDASFYCRLWAPLACSFGAISFIMAKRPDSMEKQLYSAGWLFYHSAIVLKRGKDLIQSFQNGVLHRQAMVGFMLHGSFAIGLIIALSRP